MRHHEYIWIDKECIEQEDSLEKEQAIQSMDRVYHFAARTLCLLETHISNSTTADFFQLLNKESLQHPDMRVLSGVLLQHPKYIDDLINALHLIANDRWFTRAWITQKRLCSADNTSQQLWVLIDPSLSNRGRPEEICLDVELLQDHVLHLCNKLETQDKGLARRLADALGRFHAASRLPKGGAWRRRITQAAREHFDALQVLHVLEDQGCLIQSDKLALIGNGCGWNKRINAKEAATRGFSYSACVWMLGLLNGDAAVFCQDELIVSIRIPTAQPGFRSPRHVS
ncbi:MAG: hypothetical protein M1830_004650 [Pleopsidium flavum]|nr:MAG: hypothetical protein M1830_004650 [Pleopsidium flavum]